MAAADYLYKRFTLPSGTMVEVRRVTEGARPEVTVREVNDDDELSAGEYNLRLDFLVRRCRPVQQLAARTRKAVAHG